MIFKKKVIVLILPFVCLFQNNIQSQSISIYLKGEKKIKLYNTHDIVNGSVIVSDSGLIKKVIPLKSIKKIKYSQKSYKPIGDILLSSGKWLLNCSLFPAVIGYPTLFYSYGVVSSAMIASGVLINEVGSRIGRKVITYKFNGLNYINRELIFSSIFADMKLYDKTDSSLSGEYYHKPNGKKITLPRADWFFDFSAKKEPVGIEAWIIKHKLREKKFLEFAGPKK